MPGQGLRSDRKPPPSSTTLPSLSTTAASMPGNGLVAEPGLVGVMPGSGVIMMWPVSVCHQVSTIGHFSPPITLWYQAHARGLIGSATAPRAGVDRLADRPEQPQRREVVLLRVLVAPLDAGADGGRGGVEDRHAVLLDDLPPAVLVRVVRRALV